MYLIYVFTGISHREFANELRRDIGRCDFFKPHNVAVRSGANIHPYGTIRFYIVFPFHKNTHSVVLLLEFHHQRKMTRKKSNEWIERMHGMGFKGGTVVQRVWGWKDTNTNFFHSTLNGLLSCGTEFKGFFGGFKHNYLMFLSLFELTTCFGLCIGPASRHKIYDWGGRTVKVKGKAAPLQSRSGPEGSRKLIFPDFVTTAQDGGKVVSLTHRPRLPSGNTPGTHFC